MKLLDVLNASYMSLEARIGIKKTVTQK